MSLRDDPLIQDIKHRIQKDIDNVSDSLASGAAGSYDVYQKKCGKIYGLKLALSLIDESIDKYVNDEE